jgi:hypothetical protein
MSLPSLYLPLNPKSAQHRDHGRLQTVNGQSEFWAANKAYANAMCQAFGSERRLAEVQRPLTAPSALKKVAQPLGPCRHDVA